uniref:Uncharacterized protein n=1 Tax=Chelydra serpentina TaxID=8475 RepID=A0A8C3SEZ4_CHESE
MKKFASTRSLNKILQQCDSSSREYEEIQAVEKKWHLHLATPRKFLDKKCKMPSLFLPAPPPPKRAPSTTLTLRSKSMTAELEELGKRGAWGRDAGTPPFPLFLGSPQIPPSLPASRCSREPQALPVCPRGALTLFQELRHPRRAP